MGGKSIKIQLLFVYSQLRTFFHLDFSDFFCLLQLSELGWSGGRQGVGVGGVWQAGECKDFIRAPAR